MYNKVLIAEDHQSLKISIEETLKKLSVKASEYTYYCDDALLALKHGISTHEPFDLLITDLSFKEDHREQKLKSGAELVEAAKKLQPEIKILVFSAEANPAVIRDLSQKYAINGYVIKGRDDASQLEKAIKTIHTNKKYFPVELQQEMRRKNAHDFTSYDIMLVSQLAQGTSQKDIPDYLSQQGIKPASLSSVEKRLHHIRESLGFVKNEQLVAYCKDQQVI